MSDYLVRATAADLHIRAFAVRSTDLVQKAYEIHQTSPVCTAALGRLLSAGAMMGSMMKGDTDVETIQIRSDGPIKGMTVTADNAGNVKGFINNPQVDIPLKDEQIGKLDVGTAVGRGIMSVIMDLGLKELLSDQDLEITDTMPVQYFCNCSRDRVMRSLAAISNADLQEMIDDNKPVEMQCYFCHSKYTFTPDELKKIIAERNAQQA